MTVGVVLPVLDGEAFIGEAIDSVLAQTFERFELVVVDGGSTDGTVSVVRGYDDPRISLVAAPGTGTAAARNRGVSAVGGDLLAFIDHDDVWHPEKLRRHVDHHRATDAALVYSDARRIDADGTVLGPARRPDPAPPGEPLVRQLLLDDELVILTPSTVTLRRSAWDAVGGHDPSYRISEDADLYLRLAGAHRFERLPECLVDRRERDDGLSRNYRAMYRAHGRLLTMALQRYPFLDAADERRRRARTAYLRATSALLAGESAEAMRYGREALRFEPRLRPLLVVLLGALDRLSGPLDLGHRLLTAYSRRRGT